MRQLQRGNVDNEGCVRFWMLGKELMITPDTVVAHKFRKRSPYPVGWPEFMFNRLRLAYVHFGPQRLGRVVASLRNYPGFGEALALSLTVISPSAAGNCARVGCETMTGIANGSISSGRREDVTQQRSATNGEEEEGDQEEGGEESRTEEEGREEEGIESHEEAGEKGRA